MRGDPQKATQTTLPSSHPTVVSSWYLLSIEPVVTHDVSYCRPYTYVEEQLKWFGIRGDDIVVPRALLRELLTECQQTELLQQQQAVVGNNLAACQHDGNTMVFSTTGAVGEQVQLTCFAEAGHPELTHVSGTSTAHIVCLGHKNNHIEKNGQPYEPSDTTMVLGTTGVAGKWLQLTCLTEAGHSDQTHLRCTCIPHAACMVAQTDSGFSCAAYGPVAL